MTVLYGFYIFNRNGDMIYSVDWSRETPSVDSRDLLGLSTVLQDILSRLPPPGSAAGAGVKAMRTGNYKAHLLVVATGYRFCLFTDPSTATSVGQEVLQRLYEGPFVTHVAKDPAFDHDGATSITSASFPGGVLRVLVDTHMLAAPAAS
jgi:hypothetical protein